MKMKKNRNRSVLANRGVTIVELLVTISVVGVLLALLLPAVASSRESARRIQCQHHLREIGIACQNHVSTHRAFPYTSSSPGRIIGDEGDSFQLAASPHAMLMASLDHSIYNKIDFEDRWLTDLSRPLGAINAANNAILKVNLPFLRCPSDRQQAGANNYRANVGIGLRHTFPDRYLACLDDRNGRGAFMNAKATRPNSFSDGLSNTVLFSEKVIGDFSNDRMSPFRDRFSWPTAHLPCSIDGVVRICTSQAPSDYSHLSFGGSNWLVGGLNATWYNHLLTPNSKTPDCGKGGTISAGGGAGIYTARSFHLGGVNILLADGSGRFVSESVSTTIWQAIGTRNGSELVSDF